MPALALKKLHFSVIEKWRTWHRARIIANLPPFPAAKPFGPADHVIYNLLRSRRLINRLLMLAEAAFLLLVVAGTALLLESASLAALIPGIAIGVLLILLVSGLSISAALSYLCVRNQNREGPFKFVESESGRIILLNYSSLSTAIIPVILFFFGLLLLLVGLAVQKNGASGWPLLIGGTNIILVPALITFSVFLRRQWTNRVVLTGKYLLMTKGILFTTCYQARLDEIEKIDKRRNLADMIFGSGKPVLTVAGKRIKGPRVASIRQLIYKTQKTRSALLDRTGGRPAEGITVTTAEPHFVTALKDLLRTRFIDNKTGADTGELQTVQPFSFHLARALIDFLSSMRRMAPIGISPAFSAFFLLNYLTITYAIGLDGLILLIFFGVFAALSIYLVMLNSIFIISDASSNYRLGVQIAAVQKSSPSFKPTLASGSSTVVALPAVVFLHLLAIGGLVMLTHRINSMHYVMDCLFSMYIFVCLFCPAVAYAAIKIRQELICFGADRLLLRTKLLETGTLDLSYCFINSFKVHRPVFGRLFDFGWVEVRASQARLIAGPFAGIGKIEKQYETAIKEYYRAPRPHDRFCHFKITENRILLYLAELCYKAHFRRTGSAETAARELFPGGRKEKLPASGRYKISPVTLLPAATIALASLLFLIFTIDAFLFDLVFLFPLIFTGLIAIGAIVVGFFSLVHYAAHIAHFTESSFLVKKGVYYQTTATGPLSEVINRRAQLGKFTFGLRRISINFKQGEKIGFLPARLVDLSFGNLATKETSTAPVNFFISSSLEPKLLSDFIHVALPALYRVADELFRLSVTALFLYLFYEIIEPYPFTTVIMVALSLLLLTPAALLQSGRIKKYTRKLGRLQKVLDFKSAIARLPIYQRSAIRALLPAVVTILMIFPYEGVLSSENLFPFQLIPASDILWNDPAKTPYYAKISADSRYLFVTISGGDETGALRIDLETGEKVFIPGNELRGQGVALFDSQNTAIILAITPKEFANGERKQVFSRYRMDPFEFVDQSFCPARALLFIDRYDDDYLLALDKNPSAPAVFLTNNLLSPCEKAEADFMLPHELFTVERFVPFKNNPAEGWLSSELGGSICRANLIEKKIYNCAPVGLFSWEIAIEHPYAFATESGKVDRPGKVWVTRTFFKKIEARDSTTGKFIKSIPLFGVPRPLLIEEEPGLMFVGMFFGHRIDIIDLNTDEIVGRLAGGKYQRLIVRDYKRNKFYLIAADGIFSYDLADIMKHLSRTTTSGKD